MANEDFLESFYRSVNDPSWLQYPSDVAVRSEQVITIPTNYFYPLFVSETIEAPNYLEWVYRIRRAAIDPLIPDLVEFFGKIRHFVDSAWGWLGGWITQITSYIEAFWHYLQDDLYYASQAIKSEIIGLANWIANMVTLVSWSLVEDLWNTARNLFHPFADWVFSLITGINNLSDRVWEAIKGVLDYPASWMSDLILSIKAWFLDSVDTAWNAINSGASLVSSYIAAYIPHVSGTISAWMSAVRDTLTGIVADVPGWIVGLADSLWPLFGAIRDMVWDAQADHAFSLGADLKAKVDTAIPVLVEQFRDALVYVWDSIKAVVVFVTEDLVNAVTNATTGAIGWIKDEFVNLAQLAYNELLDFAGRYSPMTPDKALEVAGLMFGSAVGFGTLAHSMSLAVEAIPNLKYMGTHYLSAFMAHMGGFGLISSATMGILAANAIREPFDQYLKSVLRPVIPDSRLLIEFRAKRELNKEQFANTMRFHGYNNTWIDKIDSWLWKDPRLFEILYCADVTVPPREWLVRKFERAGYEDIDIDTLVRVVERRTTQSPRTYYTTSLRRNFRHGFLTETDLEEGVDALELAKDAIDWLKRAGELDNIYEDGQDWIQIYKESYRNDLISEEEFRADLKALGLLPDRVESIVSLEYVRKQPKIFAAEQAEVEKQWREVQGEYSSVYIEYFRKGLINEVTLAAYLRAIGINEKVADMTARLEAIKQLPKPKPEPIAAPAIPPPVQPPTYQ